MKALQSAMDLHALAASHRSPKNSHGDHRAPVPLCPAHATSAAACQASACGEGRDVSPDCLLLTAYRRDGEAFLPACVLCPVSVGPATSAGGQPRGTPVAATGPAGGRQETTFPCLGARATRTPPGQGGGGSTSVCHCGMRRRGVCAKRCTRRDVAPTRPALADSFPLDHSGREPGAACLADLFTPCAA